MNFLAHLYLSGSSEKLILGNFIGDFIKGRNFGKFDEEVIRGIKLHREIDRYADSHPVFAESVKRLRPKYRKYSGVVVDVFYDHFLAKEWNRFSAVPLLDTSLRFHSILKKNILHLPGRSPGFLFYMIQKGIPHNYADLETIRKVLKGLSRRASFVSGMEHATEDLELHYEDFEKEFLQFFPEMVGFVKEIQRMG